MVETVPGTGGLEGQGVASQGRDGDARAQDEPAPEKRSRRGERERERERGRESPWKTTGSRQ